MYLKLELQIIAIGQNFKTEVRINHDSVVFAFKENVTDEYNELIINPVALEIQDKMLELGFDGALLKDEHDNFVYDTLFFAWESDIEEKKPKMTTQAIKKELFKRDVIIYSLRKVKPKKNIIEHKNGYIATYAIRVSENCSSTEEELWVENKMDLLDMFS